MTLAVDALVGSMVRVTKRIESCECWNSSSGNNCEIPSGMWLLIEGIRYPHEKARVVQASWDRPQTDKRKHIGGITNPDGSTGYRYIVPDEILESSVEVVRFRNLEIR